MEQISVPVILYIFSACPASVLSKEAWLKNDFKQQILNPNFEHRKYYYCFMKIFNLFFCLAFVVFAALQYNDPDPYIWIPIYLYAAVLCLMAAINRFYPRACLAGIAVYTIYAIYKVFDANGLIDWATKHHAENIAETMKAEQPWIEESREFFGLFILILVLLVNYFYARRKLKQV